MTDEDRTTDQPESTPPEPSTAPTEQLPSGEEAAPSGPRKLKRSRSDRMLAGVAGGLGRYFDVDPVIFRIGFGVSVFFGGLGALAYLALALFLPDEEGQPIIRTGSHRGALGVALTVLVVAAAVVGCIALVAAGALATALGHGVIAAAVVIAAGLVLVVSAFAGGWRWLIVPALALALGVGVAAAADLDFDGGIGEHSYAPTSAQDLPDEGYELGIGALDVDLRGLEWKRHDVVPVSVDLGIGEATIVVPSDVCVQASTHTGAGELRVVGETTDGVDVDNDQGTGSSATPRLVLDANVDVGELRVVNYDAFDLEQDGFHHDDLPGGMREAEAAACA